MACSGTRNYWDREIPPPKIQKESSISKRKRAFGDEIQNNTGLALPKQYSEKKTTFLKETTTLIKAKAVTPSKSYCDADKENFWCPGADADVEMDKSTNDHDEGEEFPDNYSSDSDFFLGALPLEVIISEPESESDSETEEQEINIDLDYDPEARRSLMSSVDQCLRTFKGLHRNPTDADSGNIRQVEDKVWTAFNNLLHNRRIPSCILKALEESVVTDIQFLLKKYPNEKEETMDDLTQLLNVAAVGSFFKDTLNKQKEANKQLYKKTLGTTAEKLLKKKRGRKYRTWETDEKREFFGRLLKKADFPLIKKYSEFKPILTKIAEYLSESTKLVLPTRHQLFKVIQKTCKNQFLFLANMQNYQLVRDILKLLAPVIQQQQKEDMEISRKEKTL